MGAVPDRRSRCSGAPRPLAGAPARRLWRGRGSRATAPIRQGRRQSHAVAATLTAGSLGGGVLLSVAWVAIKVGALSYGGGFVIIPLMQADAWVTTGG